MPLFDGPLFNGPLFGEGTHSHAVELPIPKFSELVEEARRFLRDNPPSTQLVKVIVPVGYTKRLVEALGPDRLGFQTDDPASALLGIQIVEHAWMLPDAPPWGEFADGSIRPLFREEGES